MKQYDFSILSFTGESCMIPGADTYQQALSADSKRTPELIYLQEKAAFLEAQTSYRAQKAAADGLLIDWAKSAMTLSYTRLKAIEQASKVRKFFLPFLKESETDQDFLLYWQGLESHRWLNSEPIKGKPLPVDTAPLPAITPTAPAPIAPKRTWSGCRVTRLENGDLRFMFKGDSEPVHITYSGLFGRAKAMELQFYECTEAGKRLDVARFNVPKQRYDETAKFKLYIDRLNRLLNKKLNVSNEAFQPDGTPIFKFIAE
jgi:hypothetical protein